MPEISVIVPVYKVEPYLARCVDSILNQTYTDFELILVDDGSPDNCGAICDRYATQDKRVHVIHQPNGGLSAARNAGIDLAFSNRDSQWITFIDSDDWVHSKYLEWMLAAVVSTNTNISMCISVVTDSFDLPEQALQLDSVRIIEPETFWCEGRKRTSIAVCKLFRKSCFEQVRFPIGRLHEDEFVIYQILFKEELLSLVEKGLYFYYMNPNGIIHSAWTPNRLDALEALENQIAFFYDNNYKKAYKTTIEKYAAWCAGTINYLECSGYSQKSIHIVRKKLKSIIKHHRISFQKNNNEMIYKAAYPLAFQLLHYGAAVFRILGIRK